MKYNKNQINVKNENDLYLNSNIDSLKKSKEYRKLMNEGKIKLNMSNNSQWLSSSDNDDINPFSYDSSSNGGAAKKKLKKEAPKF